MCFVNRPSPFPAATRVLLPFSLFIVTLLFGRIAINWIGAFGEGEVSLLCLMCSSLQTESNCCSLTLKVMTEVILLASYCQFLLP